jgi:hypothetical protein
MSPSRTTCRASIAIAVATASMAVLVPPAGAKAPKRCKPGKTVVTVNRHAACRPLKQVLPRLKARDEVRSDVKAALSFQPRARGRKRPKTLQQVLGRRRAATVRRKLLKALPTLLDRIGGPPSAAARARATQVITDPCDPRVPDFKSKRSGIGLELSKGQATLTADAGPLTVEVSFPGGIQCDRFKVPPCPTAAGVVDGHDDRSPEFRVVIFDGEKLLYNATFQDTGHTELHGQVAADAKLDELVISDRLRHVVRLGGSAVGFTYTEDGTVERTLTVNMRTGAQTTGNVATRDLVRLNGRSPGAGYQENAGYVLLVQSGPEFVALVDQASKRYRAAETGWNADGACAAIDVAPAGGTLRLHRGDHGRAAATVRALAGGTAADAIATVTGQTGGTFSPQQAHSPTPGFDYTVTADRGQLTLSVHATSTAGAASASWTQPISPAEWPVKRIAGTFSGVEHQQGVTTTWTGSATWVRAPNLDEQNTDRAFTLTSGAYTATVSGTAGDHCQINGQKQFTIPASPSRRSITVFNPAADVVFGTGKADWQLPWDYFWETTPTSEQTMDVTLSGCDDPHEDGTTTMGAPKSTGGLPGRTADGFSFAGTFEFTDPDSGDSVEETWNLKGTPTS